MKLNTSSAIVAFARKLENKSAAFYEQLAQMDAVNSAVFLSFVKENRKNAVQIERAYYGVITDAIEGSFTFNLSVDEYEFDVDPPAVTGIKGGVKKALEIEDKITGFYLAAAEQSKNLLADIPRVFALTARKRNARKSKLISLYAEGPDY